MKRIYPRCSFNTIISVLLLSSFGMMGASAQSTTYTNGENNSGTLDSSGGITLTIASGTATQSGAISGSGSVTVNPSSADLGTLTFTGTNAYTGGTAVNFGMLTVSNGGTVSDNNGYIGWLPHHRSNLRGSWRGQPEFRRRHAPTHRRPKRSFRRPCLSDA